MPDVATSERDLRVRGEPAIRAGASFDGLLVLRGDARIEGRVSGEIVGVRRLQIGEAGSVEANVEADEVVVAGSLEGDVRARQRLELRAGARVRGRLETPRLCMADGAVFEGPCRIVADAAVPPRAPESP